MFFEEYYNKNKDNLVLRRITDKIMEKIAILAAYLIKMKELVILDLDGVIIDGQSQKILLNYLFKQKIIGSFFI